MIRASGAIAEDRELVIIGSQSTKSSATTQGVGPETAVLPAGWDNRLVRIETAGTNGIAGLCLEVHDLAISKYIAGRPKDLDFTRELAAHRLTSRETLLERLAATRVSRELSSIVRARILADFKRARSRK